jgi:hypothetical protein
MVKLAIGLAVSAMLLAAGSASAGTVKLEWDPVTQATGYNVYADGAKSTSVTATTATVTVPAGAHSFYVTAYNSWGESAPSNTVTTPPAAVAPGNLRVTVTVDIQTP